MHDAQLHIIKFDPDIHKDFILYGYPMSSTSLIDVRITIRVLPFMFTVEYDFWQTINDAYSLV